MKPEAEDFEHKSKFQGFKSEWLTLIKIIVAMANTKGGTIKINDIQKVKFSEFDTAEIDDKVNAYINPRIHNIISKKDYSNSMEILVPNSNAKPHIFRKDGAYENPSPPPQQKFEFYEGQIWVRHSGKNERATKKDTREISR
ncbi:ATP-binding protein [candidate division NPL-UPA2 bacterium]|nr:ATP-binding protein [candidate division NPL-UPA2 bacterium]